MANYKKLDWKLIFTHVTFVNNTQELNINTEVRLEKIGHGVEFIPNQYFTKILTGNYVIQKGGKLAKDNIFATH